MSWVADRGFGFLELEAPAGVGRRRLFVHATDVQPNVARNAEVDLGTRVVVGKVEITSRGPVARGVRIVYPTPLRAPRPVPALHKLAPTIRAAR